MLAELHETVQQIFDNAESTGPASDTEVFREHDYLIMFFEVPESVQRTLNNVGGTGPANEAVKFLEYD